MKRLLAAFLCLPLAAWPIPQDKQGHFLGGVAIGFTASFAVRWGAGTDATHSARVGFLIGAAAGIQKEYLDNYDNVSAIARGQQPVHGVEAYDAGATIAGAAVGATIAYYLLKQTEQPKIVVQPRP